MMRRTASTLADLPMIATAPRGELAALDGLTTTVAMDEGRVLMREGAFGNEVHILLEGELLVERGGEPVAVLSPGAVVGEQAVLLNLPRNATVTAATDVTVAAMNRREFSTVLERCPTIGRLILSSAIERAGAPAN